MEIGGMKVTGMTILLVVLSMGLGAWLNYLTTQAATKKANETLFAQIKAELDTLKTKHQTARLLEEDAKRIRDLEGALAILEAEMKQR